VSYGLSEVGSIEFSAPETLEPKAFKLTLKATSRNRIVSENVISIFVVPKDLINTRISALNSSIWDSFKNANIDPCKVSEAGIVYATSFSEELETLAKEGKTVILELSEDTKFSRFRVYFGEKKRNY
jgi:hypothetical protein